MVNAMEMQFMKAGQSRIIYQGLVEKILLEVGQLSSYVFIWDTAFQEAVPASMET